MISSDRILRLTVHLLRLPSDDSEERPKQILVGNLRRLNLLLNRFGAAVALYDLCQPANQNPAVPAEHANCMRLIAGSSGAMTIHAIGQLIRHTKDQLHILPGVRAHVAIDHLCLADAQFEKNFPTSRLVRNAAAHPETFGTPQKLEKHMATGEYDTPLGKALNEGGVMILSDNFYNRTYFSMIEKQVVSYDLTSETHQILKSIVEAVYSAFLPE